MQTEIFLLPPLGVIKLTLHNMDPKEVATAINGWIQRNQSVSMYTVKQYVWKLLSPRYYHDHLQGIIIDRGINLEISGSKKEGLQASMILNTVDDFRVQWADAEIVFPTTKPQRTLDASIKGEVQSVTSIFFEFYQRN